MIVANSYREGCKDPASPYDGFSVCTYTGDNVVHTQECLEQLSREIHVSAECIFMPRQVHGTRVAVVGTDNLDGADAVIVTGSGKAAAINTADCVPVVIIDEERQIAAAVHAGWRGAVAGVIQETVARMKALGAHNMKGFIGPCICRECFEVGEEVATFFPEKFIDRSKRKPHVDLPAYVKDVLNDSGVTVSVGQPPCTRCEWHHYFSARRLGIQSGRNLTLVWFPTADF